jgi:hypothetical protein
MLVPHFPSRIYKVSYIASSHLIYNVYSVLPLLPCQCAGYREYFYLSSLPLSKYSLLYESEHVSAHVSFMFLSLYLLCF